MESFALSASAGNWADGFNLDLKKDKNLLEINGPVMTGVEVPVIPNPEEYEYLPGHFNVRYVIQEVSSDISPEPAYLVKLESREIATVSK
jgi:hypothetical protein